MTEPDLDRMHRTDLDRALDIFLSERTRLVHIAYRVTGDLSGAEDVVQEAWVRWQRTDRTKIKNPAAFLTTTTTHLAVNVIQSARHRHETPTESPLRNLTDPGPDPTTHSEQRAALEGVLGLLMGRLSPAELAAYLMRKGFDYAYAEIALLLGTSVPNARQLVRRAQAHIGTGRQHSVDPRSHRLLVAAFRTAARTGDLTALEALLVGHVHGPPSRRRPLPLYTQRPRRSERRSSTTRAA